MILAAIGLTAFTPRPVHLAQDSLLVSDITGNRIDFLHTTATKRAILIFILHDCPICNGYAPEINRIAAYAKTHHLATYLVYSDPDLAPSEARAHYSEYGNTTNALLDPDHKLARYFAITVAPEALLLNDAGKPVYRGAIDNAYPKLGVHLAAVTSHDLRDAIAALLSRKPIPESHTKLVGCYIQE